MCHGSIGESTDQLKRDIADPIVKVVMVKFIGFHQRTYYIALFLYHSDTKSIYYYSFPSCVSIAAPKKVPKRIIPVARSAIVVMEKIIYFFDKYKCLLMSVSPHQMPGIICPVVA